MNYYLRKVNPFVIMTKKIEIYLSFFTPTSIMNVYVLSANTQKKILTVSRSYLPYRTILHFDWLLNRFWSFGNSLISATQVSLVTSQQNCIFYLFSLHITLLAGRSYLKDGQKNYYFYLSIFLGTHHTLFSSILTRNVAIP